MSPNPRANPPYRRMDQAGPIRSAFSLMELIIVLAILIIVAAMSAPTLIRTMSGQKLDRAADLVRARMGQARVDAIRTGQVTALFYQIDGAAMDVAPFNAEQLKRLEAAPVDETNRSSNMDFRDNRLPRGIQFTSSHTSNDARAAQTMADIAFRPGQMRPILFYPDGTSQNAKLILQNAEGDAIQINLRGLTGTTSLTKIIDDRQVGQ